MFMRVLLGLGLVLVVALHWWLLPEVSRAACSQVVTTHKIAFDRRLLQRKVDGVVVALPAEMTKVESTEYPFSSKCWVTTYFGNVDIPAMPNGVRPVRVVCEYAGNDELAVHLLGGEQLAAHGEECVHGVTIEWYSKFVVAPTRYEVFREIAKRTE
jgi:hypothetical protein